VSETEHICDRQSESKKLLSLVTFDSNKSLYMQFGMYPCPAPFNNRGNTVFLVIPNFFHFPT
jgi:hypothetical protein